MANTTIAITTPTNKYWKHCGPPTTEMKEYLERLSGESKKSRIDWLQKVCRKEALPSGPYPFHVANRGWFKGHIYDERFQPMYIMRDDLNLDVEIFQVVRSPDAQIIKRVLVEDENTMIGIRVSKIELWAYYKDAYPEEFDKIVARWEHAQVPVGTLKALIAREVEVWKEYDAETMQNLRMMHAQSGARPGPMCSDLSGRHGHLDATTGHPGRLPNKDKRKNSSGKQRSGKQVKASEGQTLPSVHGKRATKQKAQSPICQQARQGRRGP